MRSLSRRSMVLSLAAFGFLSSKAQAKPKRPKIRWTILLPERQDQARIEQLLKNILKKETLKAHWGKGYTDEVDAIIDIKELHTRTEKDIVRVSCSALGKIKELGVTRTRFSYGGRVAQRAQLEKHILELVARGIIVRLAELAREKYGGWKVSR